MIQMVRNSAGIQKSSLRNVLKQFCITRSIGVYAYNQIIWILKHSIKAYFFENSI